EEKGLELRVEVDPQLPPILFTDAQRLQQILRDLVSNAVKFTDAGSVTLLMGVGPADRVYGLPTLDGARRVISSTVQDTGIGISDDKLTLIFEAFQQADGTTSRKYGGTGLGLSISRELARLLGGLIDVRSRFGDGSTFVLYLPDSLPVESMPALSAYVPALPPVRVPVSTRPAP